MMLAPATVAVTTFFALAAGLVAQPEPLSPNLFPEGEAETSPIHDTGGEAVPRTTTAARTGDACFELSEKRTTTFSRMIPVDPAKHYRLSAWMRSGDPALPASANFGLSMYDAEKRFIALCHVRVFEGTQTTLPEAAPKGSTRLLVADASAWADHAKAARIAFNAEPDYRDLPNFQLSPPLGELKRTERGWEATLATPLEADYPEGTPIRLHGRWNASLYWIANDWVPPQWTEYATVLHGEAASGVPKDQFWAKTRYVRVNVRFGNWDRIPKEGARLLVDDIVFQEMAPEPLKEAL